MKLPTGESHLLDGVFHKVGAVTRMVGLRVMQSAAGIAIGVPLGAVMAGSAAFASAAEDRAPNLLVITVDTLRADHIGAYGHSRARTRYLDQFAGVSVRFENAVTPFPRTTPALATLFTGLWPHHHGSVDVGVPFETGSTLAQVLQQQGYQTIGVSSTSLASHKQHFNRGFVHFDGPTEAVDLYLATKVTDRALQLAQQASGEQPLFLWVHYFDPHFPYEPPRGFSDQPVAPSCRRLSDKVIEDPEIEGNLHSNWGRVGERTRADCMELYDASIHYTDREIGRLLAGLGGLGFLESVTIAITSDHGESFGEAGMHYEHGATVHDAVVRIPLLIASRGIRAHLNQDLVSLEDIMPTLLALLGVSKDAWPAMDGRDLSGRIEGSADAEAISHVAFARSANTTRPPLFVLPFDGTALRQSCTPGRLQPECARFAGVGQLLATMMMTPLDISSLPPTASILKARRAISQRFDRGETHQASARTKRFKLVQAPRLDGGIQRALFDLESSEGETVDASARFPDVMQSLSSKLDRWLATLPEVPPNELDAQDIEMLRSLGYLDPGDN